MKLQVPNAPSNFFPFLCSILSIVYAYRPAQMCQAPNKNTANSNYKKTHFCEFTYTTLARASNPLNEVVAAEVYAPKLLK